MCQPLRAYRTIPRCAISVQTFCDRTPPVPQSQSNIFRTHCPTFHRGSRRLTHTDHITHTVATMSASVPTSNKKSRKSHQPQQQQQPTHTTTTTTTTSTTASSSAAGSVEPSSHQHHQHPQHGAKSSAASVQPLPPHDVQLLKDELDREKQHRYVGEFQGEPLLSQCHRSQTISTAYAECRHVQC